MQPSEWENSCHRIGTCALTGSAALFASIPGSYVIVNGPLWCYFYAMKYIDCLSAKFSKQGRIL